MTLREQEQREKVREMKALVKYAHGEDNVELRERQIPEPGPGEVLIEVKAAGVCGTDIHIYKEDNYPIRPPVTLGHELSGVIRKIGEGVAEIETGLRVTSETYYSTCGHCVYCRTGRKNLCAERRSIGSGVDGAMAEYVVVPAANLHRLPENVSFEEGAMIEPLACCVQAVYDKISLNPSDRVVITGPGTIGLLCLQVVKQFGCATVVTGADGDEERLLLAEKLGADHTAKASEAAALISEITGGFGADVCFECSGAVPAVSMGLEILRKGGRYVQVGLPSKPAPIDMNAVALREYTIVGTNAQKPIYWDAATDLVARGKVDLKPLSAHVHRLTDWEEAFGQVMKGVGFKHILIPG
jgi:L-iditol 2-dehydrogenase